nr:hypothetical protein [uncultured Actinoplanes sp.]
MSFEVPDSCTLPTAERPLRLAEFDELFATAVREVESPAPTRARLRLAGVEAARVRDLTAREAECCSFFTFTVAESPLTLEIEVPPGYAYVLDSLVQRAR